MANPISPSDEYVSQFIAEFKTLVKKSSPGVITQYVKQFVSGDLLDDVLENVTSQLLKLRRVTDAIVIAKSIQNRNQRNCVLEKVSLKAVKLDQFHSLTYALESLQGKRKLAFFRASIAYLENRRVEDRVTKAKFIQERVFHNSLTPWIKRKIEEEEAACPEAKKQSLPKEVKIADPVRQQEELVDKFVGILSTQDQMAAYAFAAFVGEDELKYFCLGKAFMQLKLIENAEEILKKIPTSDERELLINELDNYYRNQCLFYFDFKKYEKCKIALTSIRDNELHDDILTQLIQSFIEQSLKKEVMAFIESFDSDDQDQAYSILGFALIEKGEIEWVIEISEKIKEEELRSDLNMMIQKFL